MSYRALDSDAFARGQPLTSWVTRAVIRNSNHLRDKGEALPSLAWTSGDAIPFDEFRRWAPLPGHWTRILPPIPIRYRRGCRRMEVRVNGLVSGNIALQVATSAAPFREGASTAHHNRMELTDSAGLFSAWAKADLWCHPSGEDYLDLRMTSVGYTTNPADATGGVPRSRADLTGPPEYNIHRVGGIDVGFAVVGGVFAIVGTQIDFGAAATRRQIVGARANDLIEWGSLWWGPVLTSVELAAVIAADDFTLYASPSLTLGTISIMAYP